MYVMLGQVDDDDDKCWSGASTHPPIHIVGQPLTQNKISTHLHEEVGHLLVPVAHRQHVGRLPKQVPVVGYGVMCGQSGCVGPCVTPPRTNPPHTHPSTNLTHRFLNCAAVRAVGHSSRRNRPTRVEPQRAAIISGVWPSSGRRKTGCFVCWFWVRVCVC